MKSMFFVSLLGLALILTIGAKYIDEIQNPIVESALSRSFFQNFIHNIKEWILLDKAVSDSNIQTQNELSKPKGDKEKAW
jgi:hypothetical protein